MEKKAVFDQKYILTIVVSLLIGVGVSSVFYYVHPLKRPMNQVVETPSPSSEVPTPQEVVRQPPNASLDVVLNSKRLLTYQNHQFGFELQYPEEFYAHGEGGIEPGQALVNFLNVNTRNDDGYAHESFHFTVIKKEKVVDLYKRLVDQKAAGQKEREKHCAILSPEEFDQCAYYGGGVTYEISSLAGAESVQAEFAGEGPGQVTIYLSTKGIQISYYVDSPSFDPESILNSIRFFDEDRIVRDKETGISFRCAAYSTCKPNGSRYHSHLDTETQAYYLESRDGTRMELLLKNGTKDEVNNTMRKREVEFTNRQKEYDTFYANCLLKTKKEACMYTMSGARWPHRTYNFMINKREAFVFEDRLPDHASSDITLFIPEIGIMAIVNNHGALIDQAFLEKLFAGV